jgi:regulator of replication initiation timing
MNQLMMILTHREIFLIIIGSITYIALFIVTVQNSRRKILLLRQRLEKIHSMQEEQEAMSMQRIEQNRQKIAELENLLQKMGDENSMLRLELEEKKARLGYANTMAIIENEKRQQAETAIFSSDIYLKLKRLMVEGRSLSDVDWQQLMETVDGVYTGFTEKLYSLYKMSEQDYHVCLLIKVRVSPKDIATLTAHSKESVATTRSRLYQKIFGRKGSTHEWDEFVLSL